MVVVSVGLRRILVLVSDTELTVAGGGGLVVPPLSPPPPPHAATVPTTKRGMT
jgi:hypothetical protein